MSYAGKSPEFEYIYFGDRNTDGSFRIRQNGANLEIEVRAAGVWVAKDTIEP